MKKQKDMVDIKYRPAMINKETMDLLLKQKESVGIIALYVFYNYTAIWQTTNTIKCTTGYAAEGLNINRNRIIRYKHALKELGLIEDIKRRKNNGDFGENYIKVNYYQTNPHLHDTAPLPKRDTNACSKGSTNACKVVSPKPFFGDDEISTFDDKMASIIYNLLVDEFALTRRVKLSSWSKEIVKIRITIMSNYAWCHKGYNKKKFIRALLTWYKRFYGQKYIPRIHSKADLSNKFTRIISAYERFLEDKGEVVKISKTAKRIASKLKKHEWHPKSVEQLEMVVQKSLTNYKPLYEKHKIIKTLRQLEPFCRNQLSRMMYNPETFVREWFVIVLEHVKDWKKWKGDLVPFIFDIDHTLFNERGRELSQEWHHSNDAWAKYKTALKSKIIMDGK